jgi:hypothetical protein
MIEELQHCGRRKTGATDEHNDCTPSRGSSLVAPPELRDLKGVTRKPSIIVPLISSLREGTYEPSTLVALVLGFCVTLVVDEGIWIFDNLPRDAIAKNYGVTLTDLWLGTVQRVVV